MLPMENKCFTHITFEESKIVDVNVSKNFLTNKENNNEI